MIDFTKLADFLDAMAGYVDDIEHGKTAEERKVRDDKVDQIVTHYANKTGESFSDASKEKLAGLDTDTLGEILKIADMANDGELDTLGGPANNPDVAVAPTTIKEAAEQAEDKFLSWIVSQ